MRADRRPNPGGPLIAQSSRPGPAVEVRVIERFLRKKKLLEKNERIVELKQGRIRRWLVDGSDQTAAKSRGLDGVPVFSGVATLSYSPRCLFFVGMGRFAMVACR